MAIGKCIQGHNLDSESESDLDEVFDKEKLHNDELDGYISPEDSLANAIGSMDKDDPFFDRDMAIVTLVHEHGLTAKDLSGLLWGDIFIKTETQWYLFLKRSTRGQRKSEPLTSELIISPDAIRALRAIKPKRTRKNDPVFVAYTPRGHLQSNKPLAAKSMSNIFHRIRNGAQGQVLSISEVRREFLEFTCSLLLLDKDTPIPSKLCNVTGLRSSNQMRQYAKDGSLEEEDDDE